MANHSSVHLLGEGAQPRTTGTSVQRTGGDVWTYDAETTATLLDSLTEHVRQLEVRTRALERDVRALLLTVQAPRPWWARWGRR